MRTVKKENKKTNLRRLNVSLHRDLGYFFSSLIIIYCLSGLALNHSDDWNPDFILTKDTIRFTQSFKREDINEKQVAHFNTLVGEESHKLFDFPTDDQVKIYYKDVSFHINFTNKQGVYEQISKRPLFYQTNVIHRNSLKGWKWASDIFAIMLIAITLTGILIMKGKYGIGGRGKWLMLAGFIPPLVAIIIQAVIK